MHFKLPGPGPPGKTTQQNVFLVSQETERLRAEVARRWPGLSALRGLG